MLLVSVTAQAVKDIIWYHADVYASIIIVHVYLVLLNVVVPIALLVINATVVRQARRQSNDVAERPSCVPTSSNAAALSAMLLVTSLMHVAVCGTWFTLCYIYLWTHHADLSLATRMALHEVCLIAEEPQSFVMSTAFYVYFIRAKQFRSELRKLFWQRGSAAAATSGTRHGYADSGV